MPADKKTIRQEKIRQEKIKQALLNKPNKAFINSQGIDAKELSKLLKKPSNTIMSNRTRNIKDVRKRQTAFSRPVTAQQNYSRESFLAPPHKLYKSPTWFDKDIPVDVSIIVPCFKSNEVIKKQIESWNFDEELTWEIIYVDDCCPLQSYKAIIEAWDLRKDEIKNGIGKIYINSRNSGYANSCNVGASYAKGKYLIFLNADTTVNPNWIKPLITPLQEDPEIGIVGNIHLKENKIHSCGSEWDWKSGSFQHIGFTIHNKQRLSSPYTLETLPEDLKKIREVQMVTGACFSISESLFRQFNGFNTDYKIGYWEDADLCMRIKSIGYKIICNPASVINHECGHSNSLGHPYFLENKKIFFKNWVDTKILDSFLVPFKNKKEELNKDSIVCYTAITDDYDNLKDQPNENKVDFVAFTDFDFKSKTWVKKDVIKQFNNPNRDAKIYKICPHRFFPDKEYSLWIDGSVRIVFQYGIKRLIDVFLDDCDIALFKHSERNCLYEEANVCMLRRLDDPEIIKKQIEKYTKEGYPHNIGLCECPILLRRHSNKIIDFNEAWWEEIKNGSKRDQISFNYVAKKVNLKYKIFPGHLRMKNNLFGRDGHKKLKRN